MKDIIELRTFVDSDHVDKIAARIDIHYLTEHQKSRILSLVEDRFEDTVCDMINEAILDLADEREEENRLTPEEEKEKIA